MVIRARVLLATPVERVSSAFGQVKHRDRLVRAG